MARIEDLRAAIRNLEAEVRHLENLISQDEPTDSLIYRLESTKKVLDEVRRIYREEFEKFIRDSGSSRCD